MKFSMQTAQRGIGSPPWVLGSTVASAQELVVSAAASLTNAFQEVGQAFEKARPGAKLTFNFAASGPLLAQIQQGAPVDVFASADQETMNRAASANLIAPATRVDFAQNTLVLIVPASAAPMPAALDDLKNTSYAPRFDRNAGCATVPVGRYTMEAIEEGRPHRRAGAQVGLWRERAPGAQLRRARRSRCRLRLPHRRTSSNPTRPTSP